MDGTDALGKILQFWVMLPFRLLLLVGAKDFEAAFCPWDENPLDHLKSER